MQKNLPGKMGCHVPYLHSITYRTSDNMSNTGRCR